MKAGELMRGQARQLFEHCFEIWVLFKWNGKSLKGWNRMKMWWVVFRKTHAGCSAGIGLKEERGRFQGGDKIGFPKAVPGSHQFTLYPRSLSPSSFLFGRKTSSVLPTLTCVQTLGTWTPLTSHSFPSFPSSLHTSPPLSFSFPFPFFFFFFF